MSLGELLLDLLLRREVLLRFNAGSSEAADRYADAALGTDNTDLFSSGSSVLTRLLALPLIGVGRSIGFSSGRMASSSSGMGSNP